MRTLHLTLKKKWFDLILAGIKLEEYREIKSFWSKRFTSNPTKLYVLGIGWTNYTIHRDADDFRKYIDEAVPKEVHYVKRLLDNIKERAKWKEFDTITFKNGYQKNARLVVVEFKGIDIGKARPEWSDNWQGDCFRIKLGKILSTQNVPN